MAMAGFMVFRPCVQYYPTRGLLCMDAFMVMEASIYLVIPPKGYLEVIKTAEEVKEPAITHDEVFELLVRLQTEKGILVVDPRRVVVVEKGFEHGFTTYKICLEGGFIVRVLMEKKEIVNVSVLSPAEAVQSLEPEA